MFDKCYKNVEKYKGYDIQAKDIINRIDNKQAIFLENLDDYNFFDLDAYGSPWELFFNIIIKLKNLKRAVFIVTDGLFLNNRFGSATKLQKAILRIPNRMRIPCLHKHYEFFLARLFAKVKEMTGYELKDIKIIKPNNRIKYLGFILEKG